MEKLIASGIYTLKMKGIVPEKKDGKLTGRVIFHLRVIEYSQDNHAKVDNPEKPNKGSIIKPILTTSEIKKFFPQLILKAKNLQELINEFDNLRNEKGNLFLHAKFGRNNKLKVFCILNPSPTPNVIVVSDIL